MGGNFKVNFYFLRHGEAQHNIAVRSRCPPEAKEEVLASTDLFDAQLSELGKAQAREAYGAQPTALADLLSSVPVEAKSSVKNLVQHGIYFCSSPLGRALHTASIAIPQIPSVHVIDDLREWAGGRPCDSRERLSELKRKYGKLFPQEMEICQGTDEDSLGLDAPRELEIDVNTRCFEFLRHVTNVISKDFDCDDVKTTAKTEFSVVAVSHCAFLRQLLNSLDLFDADLRETKNCQWRNFWIPFQTLSRITTQAFFGSNVPSESIPPALSRQIPESRFPFATLEGAKLRSLCSLDSLLEVVAPCTILIYPPVEKHEVELREKIREIVMRWNLKAAAKLDASIDPLGSLPGGFFPSSRDATLRTLPNLKELANVRKSPISCNMPRSAKRAVASDAGAKDNLIDKWLLEFGNSLFCLPGDTAVRNVYTSDLADVREFELAEKQWLGSNYAVLVTEWRMDGLRPTGTAEPNKFKTSREDFVHLFHEYRASFHWLPVEFFS